MKQIYFLFISIACLLYSACSNEHSALQNIHIDLTNVREITIEENNIVFLETNDSSLLYDIGSVIKLEEKYFIYSRNVVRVFDRNGNYLSDLSTKGEAPNEYLNIGNIYEENKNVFLYDVGLNKLLAFNIDGQCTFIKKVTRKQEQPLPVNLFPLNKEKYLSINSYAGEHCQVPVLSIWDKELTNQETIGGRYLNSGMRLADICYIDNSQRILYWEPIKDTLFTVTDQRLQPLYSINFGEHGLPTSISRQDVYDRIIAMGKKENYKYATFVRYYQVYNDYLFFTCVWQERTYLCRYNEKSKKTDVYSFYSKDNKFSAKLFYKIQGDNIILEVKDNTDEEKNHSLFIFPIKELDK